MERETKIQFYECAYAPVLDQVQHFTKQVPRHGNLGQLERDIATMTDNLGSNLDQILVKRVQ